MGIGAHSERLIPVVINAFGSWGRPCRPPLQRRRPNFPIPRCATRAAARASSLNGKVRADETANDSGEMSKRRRKRNRGPLDRKRSGELGRRPRSQAQIEVGESGETHVVVHRGICDTLQDMIKQYCKYHFGASVATAARRAQMTGDIVRRTAIGEPMIERLVRDFYARIRADALLGPTFDARVADWRPHLQRMCAFWASVASILGRRHGQPMEKRLPLPIGARRFDQWLDPFEQPARELCRAGAADHFIERARRMTRAPHPPYGRVTIRRRLGPGRRSAPSRSNEAGAREDAKDRI